MVYDLKWKTSNTIKRHITILMEIFLNVFEIIFTTNTLMACNKDYRFIISLKRFFYSPFVPHPSDSTRVLLLCGWACVNKPALHSLHNQIFLRKTLKRLTHTLASIHIDVFGFWFVSLHFFFSFMMFALCRSVKNVNGRNGRNGKSHNDHESSAQNVKNKKEMAFSNLTMYLWLYLCSVTVLCFAVLCIKW